MSGDGVSGEAVSEATLALLRASHGLDPSRLLDAVVAAARAGALGDVEVRLADVGRRTLVDLGHRRPPLPVDGPGPGAVYREAAAHVDEASGRVVVPLLDGAQRLGTLGVTVARPDRPTLEGVEAFASAVSLLVVAKSGYTDAIELVRRTQPMEVGAEARWELQPPDAVVTPRVAIAGVLEPAYEVAGDAFDFAVNAGWGDVAVFDGVGHDLAAARCTTLAMTAYRHARRHGADLGESYRAVDRAIAEHFPAATFVAASLARLDLEAGLFRWVSAGNPHPLLVRRGTVAPLPAASSVPPGLAAGAREPSVAEVQLEPGDRVVLFTDGVTEARLPDGRHLAGIERFVERVTATAGPSLALAEALRRAMVSLLDDVRLLDDACVVVTEWSAGAATR